MSKWRKYPPKHRENMQTTHRDVWLKVTQSSCWTSVPVVTVIFVKFIGRTKKEIKLRVIMLFGFRGFSPVVFQILFIYRFNRNLFNGNQSRSLNCPGNSTYKPEVCNFSGSVTKLNKQQTRLQKESHFLLTSIKCDALVQECVMIE